MATSTQNLGLIEPAGTDHALVANINTNSEKIDAEAGKARANFALVQNGDTATQAISQGQLVNWKGVLKKATANIANGATLSSSNLTDDSIAAELASLNGKITNKIEYVVSDLSNIDSFTTTGFYRAENGSSFLQVYNCVGQVIQIQIKPYDHQIRCRQFDGGNWGSWTYLFGQA